MTTDATQQSPAERQETEAENSAGARRKWPSTIPRWIGVGLFLYISVFALAYAQLFFIPVVLAFLLSMVFGPVRRVFDRRGVPAGLSAIIIVAALLAVLFSIAAALAVPASNWMSNASQIERKVQARFNDISGPFSGFFQAKQKLENMADGGSNNVQKVKTQGTGVVTRVAKLAPVVLAQLVFTLVLLLFLLASGDMFYEKIVHVMPTFRDKRRAARIAHDIERKLSRYLLTITIINAGLGVAVGLAMWGLDMPSPLIFGVIAFVFNFVPYLGALVGIAIAAVVALVSFQWIVYPLIVAGAYFTLTTIEGQFVTPYFVGRSLQLNTVVVFVTISFWAWLWSTVGMIVAVPLLVAVKTFSEHIDGLQPLSDFLTERHGEHDEAEHDEQDLGLASADDPRDAEA